MGGKRSASHCGHFVPVKRTSGNHETGEINRAQNRSGCGALTTDNIHPELFLV